MEAGDGTRGQKVLHAVHANGEKIGQRRSAHRYSYAFVKRHSFERAYYVTRWSRNEATKSGEIRIPLIGSKS